MRKIETKGITNIEKIDGSSWYYGINRTSGDLYESEELYQMKSKISQNRMILIEEKTGEFFEPIAATNGQYFGNAIYLDEHIYILLADFKKAIFQIYSFHVNTHTCELAVNLPRSIAKDCYNLRLDKAPLMLTRSENEGLFEILWPDKKEIKIGLHEVFIFQEAEKLYFSNWWEEAEEPYEYHEEVVIRDAKTGKELERYAGVLMRGEDGEIWVVG